MAKENPQASMPALKHNLIVTLLIFLSGIMMTRLAHPLGTSLIIHVPHGIALGAYLLYSYRVTPGIFLGTIALFFWSGQTLFVDFNQVEMIGFSALLALGSFLQVWVGSTLVQKWLEKDTPLNGISEVLIFVFGVAGLSTQIFPFWSLILFNLSGQFPGSGMGTYWLTSWLSNLLAVVHITPFFLVFQKKNHIPLAPKAVREAVLLALVLYSVSQVVYGPWLEQNDYPLVYLLFPVLVWAALRFHQHGAILAILYTALIAIWGTAEGRGPMGPKPAETAVILLQLYLFVLAAMSLVLGATIATSYQHQNESEKFGVLLNRAINEIYVIELESMKYVFVNQGACKRLGYTMEEILQMKPLDFTQGITRQELNQLIDRLLEDPDRMERVEAIHKCRNGSTYPIEAYVNIATFGNKKYLTAIATDMTDKRLAQDAIVNARIRAEEANQAKSMFISNMSHEIRTPMNAILGYVQILERDDTLSTDQKKRVDGIQKAGNHLLGLINDILDFSKIEAGKMELNVAQFSLSGLIGDLQVIFHNRCERNHLTLKVDYNFSGQRRWVEGDQGKLRQILINLLENAVKFTDQGKVFFRVTEEKKDQYLFEVVDTGCGIPLEKQEAVFDYFIQNQNGQEKGGTGLGLSISRRQVELMGGELKLESYPGWGSRFYFSIKLPSTQERPLEDLRDYDRVVALAADQSVRALIVDDNQSNIEVMQEMLTDIGIECQAVVSGWDAIDSALAWKPDIIFMDYRMPGLNGLDTAKMVQNNLDQEATKIVMVTASSYRHEKERFLREGVQGFIAKPFLRGEVFKTLHDLLGIEFVYRTNTEGQPESAPNTIKHPAQLALPAPLLSQLKKLARLGIMSQFEEVLQDVETLGPEGADLAGLLRERAENFDKNGILKLLETCTLQHPS
ncbi:putative Histidine kinase [Nitrospina gracilis 3/211]|uniref:histidine kinase n=1 Tax=Nitrospina gracilis (strain 3/211) TaxID=1266370 RepID=M1YV43_NITG3|nr:putative Histidine kinase [Nitrospina gracilis 3/211]